MLAFALSVRNKALPQSINIRKNAARRTFQVLFRRRIALTAKGARVRHLPCAGTNVSLQLLIDSKIYKHSAPVFTNDDVVRPNVSMNKPRFMYSN